MHLVKTLPKKIVFLFILLNFSFLIIRPLETTIINKLNNTSILIITTNNFDHKFLVELADTKIKRSHGLQGRHFLGMNNGMLFNFFKPTYITMWMKDTKIPLDIIFINKNGEVTQIVTNTTPYSEKIIYSNQKVIAALEINAGRAKELQIEKGNYVRHHIFN